MPYLAKVSNHNQFLKGMAYVETVNQLGNIKFRQFFRFGLLMMTRRLDPAITPNVDDFQKEYERLQKPGVVFSMNPTTKGLAPSLYLMTAVETIYARAGMIVIVEKGGTFRSA